MSTAKTTELAKKNLREAEHALKNYLLRNTYDHEKHKQLVAAVKEARNEFVARLSAREPER